MHGPVESFREDDEGRVELVQLPAQPLLDPAAFVDQVFPVIDQELQLAIELLVGARPAQPRFAQSGPGNSERVDRVRFASAACRYAARVPSASAAS